MLSSICVWHLKPCLLFMTVFLSLSVLSVSFFTLSSSSIFSHTLERPYSSWWHSGPFLGSCMCLCMYVFIPNGGQLTQSCVRCSCCVAVRWQKSPHFLSCIFIEISSPLKCYVSVLTPWIYWHPIGKYAKRQEEGHVIILSALASNIFGKKSLQSFPYFSSSLLLTSLQNTGYRYDILTPVRDRFWFHWCPTTLSSCRFCSSSEGLLSGP